MMYNWQQPDWPDFRYNLAGLEETLFSFAEQTGHVSGMFESISEEAQIEALIDTMVAEAIKTSEIEGEYLSRFDVASSIRNHLGFNKTREHVKDRRAQGVGELMVDVRHTFAEKLTEQKLFAWHEMLFNQNRHINAGAWRKDPSPMQVVSGAIGKEKIHFEGPPSSRVPDEMRRFIDWFNATAPGGEAEIRKAAVRSAIAHLYFETIHPFEDGNGRIGRAIDEKALAQTIGHPLLLSLSQAIEADKHAYYNALEQAQKSNRITPWIEYFIAITLQAQKQARQLIDFILKKSRFFDRFKNRLNERQTKVIRKMFEAGPEGFKGDMTANKYISITKTSKATATRDLQQLFEWEVLLIEGGGRSTRYKLNI